MFALQPPVASASASTLSTSQLRQYKDRVEKACWLKLKTLQLRLEKRDGSRKGFVPSVYRPARRELVGRLCQPGSSNGGSQKFSTIHSNLDSRRLSKSYVRSARCREITCRRKIYGMIEKVSESLSE